MKQAIRTSAYLIQFSLGLLLRLGLTLVASLAAANLRAETPESPPGAVCADSAKLAPLAQELASRVNDRKHEAVRKLIVEFQAEAYPELAKKEVQLGTFPSKSDYFRTRFSLSRFFFFRRMQYFVEVNPELFARDAPADGVCAILGHEMAHIADFSHGNRIRLFRLVRLLSSGYTVRFERKADLEAIRRGFGPGLINYRNWVYANIPAAKIEEKKRNYFSPQEISAIQELTRANPQLFDYWKRKVPLNQNEIEASASARK
jgi:hypothetical protein